MLDELGNVNLSDAIHTKIRQTSKQLEGVRSSARYASAKKDALASVDDLKRPWVETHFKSCAPKTLQKVAHLLQSHTIEQVEGLFALALYRRYRADADCTSQASNQT